MAAFPFSSKIFNGPLSAWIVPVSSVLDPLDAVESVISVNPSPLPGPLNSKASVMAQQEMVVFPALVLVRLTAMPGLEIGNNLLYLEIPKRSSFDLFTQPLPSVLLQLSFTLQMG